MHRKHLLNLLKELITKNQFITNELPFIAENAKKDSDTVLVKVYEASNLFDIRPCMADFPKFVKVLKNHRAELVKPYFKRNLISCIQDNGEGDADDLYFEAIHDFINLMEIKGEVFVVNSSLNADSLYEKFLSEKECKRRVKFIPCWEDWGNGGVEIDKIKIYQNFEKINVDFDRLEDKKLFCNFNMRARLHRSAAVAVLYYYDLLLDNYVTTPSYHITNEFIEREWTILLSHVNKFLENLKEKNEILNKLQNFKQQYPLRIDQRLAHPNAGSGIIDPLIYEARKNSLFEVVSETIVTGSHFFTEKTYMPIALCKPFIFFGSFNSLASLRFLGYQTFHPYIDESYDLIEDPAERCIAIAKELLRLKNLRMQNPKLFRSNYEKMFKIAEKNRENLFSKKAEKDREKLFQKIINSIY